MIGRLLLVGRTNMRNCGNCVYRDLLITEEPCDSCNYSSNWEEDTEEDTEDEDAEVKDNI